MDTKKLESIARQSNVLKARIAILETNDLSFNISSPIGGFYMSNLPDSSDGAKEGFQQFQGQIMQFRFNLINKMKRDLHDLHREAVEGVTGAVPGVDFCSEGDTHPSGNKANYLSQRLYAVAIKSLNERLKSFSADYGFDTMQVQVVSDHFNKPIYVSDLQAMIVHALFEAHKERAIIEHVDDFIKEVRHVDDSGAPIY